MERETVANKAEVFIRRMLAEGPLPARTMLAVAQSADIPRSSLYRAATRLGVVTVKDREWRGRSTWRMP